MFFEPVTNGSVLLSIRGAYSEAPLFTRQGAVFAKIGKTYHRLTPNRSLTGSRAVWVEVRLEPNTEIEQDGLDMRLVPTVLKPLEALRIAA